jgi:hypothetical protein
MALQTFQHALAELVRRPELCEQLRRSPENVSSRYDLTTRESQRLAAIINHKGMSVLCTLYRASRLEAVYTLLPLTCLVLGSQLQSELDLYWRFREQSDLQFQTETLAFAGYISQRLNSGDLKNGFVREVLDFEMAASELRYSVRRAQTDSAKPNGPFLLHPLVRVVWFSHEPLSLLKSLDERDQSWTQMVVTGRYAVVLSAHTHELEAATISEAMAELLLQMRTEPRHLTVADADSLLSLGFVVSVPRPPTNGRGLSSRGIGKHSIARP